MVKLCVISVFIQKMCWRQITSFLVRKTSNTKCCVYAVTIGSQGYLTTNICSIIINSLNIMEQQSGKAIMRAVLL